MKLEMSAKERDRLAVMGRLDAGDLTMKQAATVLGISQRHLRRVRKRWAEYGAAGLVHRSRGKPSGRRISDEVKAQALELIAEHYSDFGPTLAAEKLQENHGIHLSRETLRRWMIAQGLWRARKAKARHRQWRQRKACRGELVQIDGSHHDWLEGRGPKMVLLAAVDDATGEVFLRFAASESTEEMMGFLIDYVKRKGRPVAIYADRSSIFTTTRQATIEEQLDGKEAQTQVGRALQELGIEYIAAHSPQAKGRVERLFGVMQDRLVKEMRLAGIEDIEQANEFVEGYMERYNERFAVKPASEADLHRSAEGYELEAILSVQETRVVSGDLTVSYKGERWQIDKATAPARIKGRTVTVEQRVDGEVKMRIGDRYLQIRKIQEPAERQVKAKRRPKRKKDKIGLSPGEDHPWRGSYKKGQQPAAAAGAPAPRGGLAQ